ncbi:Hepatocyte growth factor-like protein, partial [Ooceraea biroi]
PSKNYHYPDSFLVDNTSTIDLFKCKLSQLGAEYRGFAVTTVGGFRCQSWSAEQPLHKINVDISDSDFPEKSMKLAKNYCRNPTRDPRGPWCYTLEPTVTDDECDVPLCNSGDCIITGPGAEYGGSRSFSSSKRKCKSWNKRYKFGNSKSIKFHNKHFPEGSRAKANNFCRNPDDSIGGPWCYVEEKSYELVEKEYCDIPFCDDKDCLLYTRNSSTYSMLTGLNSSYGNISFWIKLWNPLDEQNAEARILLSLLPTPSSAEKTAQDWKAGVELLISNSVSGQTYPITNNDHVFENTPDILLSSKWTGLWIAWGGGFISLGVHGVSKPLIMDEYKTRDSISSLYPDSFMHYGIMGTGVLWSADFCQKFEFLRIWPMQKSNDTQDFRFYARASRNVAIRLYQSPGALFPSTDAVEDPQPPNCIHNVADYQYQGGQWISAEELPCIPWIAENVPPDEKIADNFIDGSVIKALNRCRNPSHDPGGPYCYAIPTSHATNATKRYCSVRLCRSSEECTFFVKGHGIGRRLYVLPEHRTEGLHFSLKAWEPDQPDSITFVFTADDGLKSRYILKIGALDDEKVLLYYQSEDEGIILVKKKTLPHLLYLGKWSSFVIRIPRGRVSVYYEGATNPLFEWEHPDPVRAFLPVYYYYNSEKGHAIGVAFDCASRCHIENTQTNRYTRILPLSTWSKEKILTPDRLVLMVRAKGVVLIPLLLLPATPGFYMLTLGERGQWIYFLKNTYPSAKVYHKQRSPKPIFTTNSWTNITINWSDDIIDVFCNETIVFHYVHRQPLIFYFFSLAVDPGSWATWSANCIPSDIDGPPLDGGWSEWGPWACSASCNGGIGTRKHTVTLIKRGIAQNYTSLTVKEHESVSLPSDSNIVNSIRAESPDSEIQWSHNGIFLQNEQHRLEIKDYKIGTAVLNDSGVYTLTVHRTDGTYMIFKVVTLAVIPIKESVTIRETLPMHVACHCAILGYVYSDLRIHWTIDNKVWRDYGITVPIAVNVDHIPAVNRSHHGTWRCVAQQVDLNFKWTTNVIRVKGKRARFATGKNTTEHTFVKTEDENASFTPANSKSLHGTYNVQSRVKDSKIHTNVNQSKPRSTKVINKWSRKLFNKTGSLRKDWNSKFKSTRDETLERMNLITKSDPDK